MKVTRTAIISGGSRGIGRAIAKKLASQGVQVVVSARSDSALSAVVREIEDAGGWAEAISLDLSRPASGQRLVEFALSQYGTIDIVVNNAGATKRGDFEALTDDDWAEGFALKFFGAVRLTRAAWPHLKKAAGSVVNISGSGGRTPGAQFTIGGSVNAGLLSLTKALADQGLQDGVQVNAINPGLVRTDRFLKRLANYAAAHNLDDASAEAAMIREEKIVRIGEPEDIANLVAFVVSPEGRFLQGALIDMDGGSTKTI